MMLCTGAVEYGCSQKQENTDPIVEEPEVREGTIAPEVITPTEPPPPEKTVPEKILEQMTLEEKVCQMFIVTPEQISGYDDVTYADEKVRKSVYEYPVGGMIFFAKNLETKQQTTEMLSDIQGYANETTGIGMFMSVDEEGGEVARCAEKLGTAKFSDMAEYGKQNDANKAYEIGFTIGNDIKKLGFNLDFAPVADTYISEGNELGNRIFSSDPYIVADMATNVALGLQDAGVCATMKHFPGLGSADGDTHLDSKVVIDRTLDSLRETEFVPFKQGIQDGVSCIMVGHQIVSGIGDNLPADLSGAVITDLLRNELQFNGLVVTDSHQMNTIAEVYSSGEASVMSIKAGADIVLMPADLGESVKAVCSEVKNGRLPEERINESTLRILNQKYQLGLIDESIVGNPREYKYEEPTQENSEEDYSYDGEDSYYEDYDGEYYDYNDYGEYYDDYSDYNYNDYNDYSDYNDYNDYNDYSDYDESYEQEW